MTGLLLIGGIVLFQAADNSASKRQAESERLEKEKAAQERVVNGNAACDRAAAPSADARTPRDANDSLYDMSASVDLISAKLEVSNIQNSLDEAALAGNAALATKLKSDLEVAKRLLVEKQTESARRKARRDAHEQALQDIRDCRKFRGKP